MDLDSIVIKSEKRFHLQSVFILSSDENLRLDLLTTCLTSQNFIVNMLCVIYVFDGPMCFMSQ